MRKRAVAGIVSGMAVLVGLGIWGSPINGPALPKPDVTVKAIPSYAQDIQPFLSQSCAQCHRGSNPPLGVRLDSYEGILAGSVNGPMVIPGRPELSNLVVHLKKEVDPRLWKQCLRPGHEPTPNQIKNLERWIKTGARNN